jgi:hypothetical protein
LSEEKQANLLSRNSSLFFQLFLAFYFGAKTGIEQINLLKNFSEPITNLHHQQQQHLHHHQQQQLQPCFISFHHFVRLIKMFKPSADLNFYQRLILRLLNIQLPSMKTIALLSYFVVFDDHFESLRDVQHLFERLIDRTDLRFGIKDFSITLLQMAAFFAHNVSTEKSEIYADSSCLSFIHSPELEYSEEEETWLVGQFRLIEQAFRSLSIGEKMIREFMLFSVGVPLPKDHMPSFLSIYFERILRIYQIHSDFVELPSHLQVEHIRNNSKLGLAMMILKCESSKTFADQLRDGFGELDDTRWNELYLPLLGDKRNLPKLTMQQASDDGSVPLRNVELKNYHKLVNDLHFLVDEPWLFKICLLLTLTLPNGSGGISLLHRKYVNILRRRLQWIRRSRRESESSSSVEALSPEFEMTKIMSGLRMLDRVSEIAFQIMSSNS